MKKLLLILFVLLMPIISQAQQVSISPTSVPFWGTAPQVSKVTASYSTFEAVFLYGHQTMYDSQDGQFGGAYFGLFWEPIQFSLGEFEIEAGGGYLLQKFPTNNGTHINFSIQATYQITETIGISYEHMSNGFGTFNRLNPGVDNIGLTINFN